MMLGGALLYQGRYGEAERLLLALEKDPAMAPTATGNLGELYLRKGELLLAEARLKTALSSQPNNWDWHRSLAEVYRLRGEKGAALTEYRRTLELLERSPMADPSLLEHVRAQVLKLEE